MTSFRRDKIGFIFQLFNLFPFLSAVENVETPLLLKGMNSGVAREQAKMILRELGMGDRLYHTPSELSGGQQQRIAVARALITEPAIILGDEPTGDLDSTTSADVMNLFRRINKINRQTLVLVTHNRWIAEQCDYIVHMSDGKVSNVEYGPFTTTGGLIMQVYTAGLIDKSVRSINAKLQKKLVSECKKNLRVSNKAMSSQELNTFFVLSGKKEGTVDPKVIEAIETGSVYKQFKKYYVNNESKLQQQLKDDQELARNIQDS